MTDEQIENIIYEHRDKDITAIPKEIIAAVMDYKSRHIKARIPEIYFQLAAQMLRGCSEKTCLNCYHCEFDGRYNDMVCYADDDWINECPKDYKPCKCWMEKE